MNKQAFCQLHDKCEQAEVEIHKENDESISNRWCKPCIEYNILFIERAGDKKMRQ